MEGVFLTLAREVIFGSKKKGNDVQLPRIYAGLEIEFPSAQTVAEFII